MREPLQRGQSVWGPKGFFIGRVGAIVGECFLLQGGSLGDFWLPQGIITSIIDREVRLACTRDELEEHRCPHGSHFPAPAP